MIDRNPSSPMKVMRGVVILLSQCDAIVDSSLETIVVEQPWSCRRQGPRRPERRPVYSKTETRLSALLGVGKTTHEYILSRYCRHR